MDEIISQQELLQRATPIIEAMAASKLVYKSRGSCECPYCPLSGVPLKERLLGIKPEQHFANCPIRLAAAWMEEWRKTQL